MILDSIDNAERYLSLLPAMRSIAAYVEANDIASLAEGRHDIDGDRLYVNVAYTDLRPLSQAALEVHNRYIDVQLVVEGEESFGWRQRSECCNAEGEFDAERDILFYRDTPQTVYRLHAGQFTIFFPEDAHAPLIGEGRVRKLIFKVEL